MKRLGVVLTACGAAAVVLAAVLLSLAARHPSVRSYVAGSLTQAVGRPVRVGALAIRLWPPALEARDVQVADDPRFGPEPFAVLDRAVFRPRLRPLLLGRMELDTVTLTRPRVRLMEGSDGRWNVATLRPVREATAAGRAASGVRDGRSPAIAAADLPASGRLIVEEGSATLVTPAVGVGILRLGDVRLVVTAAGGRLSVKGGAVARPGDVALTLHEVRVTPGGRGAADARLEGALSVRGGIAAAPLGAMLPAGLALEGSLAGRLALGGTLSAPSLGGEVTLEDASLAREGADCQPPGPRRLALDAVSLALSWADGVMSGRPLQAAHGGGSVVAALRAATGPGGSVALEGLRVTGLPLGPVLGGFLCDGYAVTGPLDLVGRLAFDPRDPARTLAGNGRLAIRGGAVTGPRALALFGDVARAGGVAAPFEFDSITATYRIAEGVISTHDLRYTGPEMRVWAEGRYALATGELEVAMRVQHAGGRVRARLWGTAQAPALRIDSAVARLP